MESGVLNDDDIPKTEEDKFGLVTKTKVNHWVMFFTEKYPEIRFDILDNYSLVDYFTSLTKLTKTPSHTRYNVEVKYADDKIGVFNQSPLLLKDINTERGLLLTYLEDRLNYYLIDDVSKLIIKEYTTKYYPKRKEHKVNWSKTNNGNTGLQYSFLCKMSLT